MFLKQIEIEKLLMGGEEGKQAASYARVTKIPMGVLIVDACRTKTAEAHCVSP
jgi:hypothetical protein